MRRDENAEVRLMLSAGENPPPDERDPDAPVLPFWLRGWFVSLYFVVTVAAVLYAGVMSTQLARWLTLRLVMESLVAGFILGYLPSEAMFRIRWRTILIRNLTTFHDRELMPPAIMLRRLLRALPVALAISMGLMAILLSAATLVAHYTSPQIGATASCFGFLGASLGALFPFVYTCVALLR